MRAAASVLPNDRFRCEVSQGAQGTMVRLIGVMDEDAILDHLLTLKGPFVINFRDVTSINSCGIRNWVNIVRSLSQHPILYEECPPVIVRQLNMVPSFKGHATIQSVLVPYACDHCDREKLVLFSQKELENPEAFIEKPMSCERCSKGEMSFEESTEEYFAFLE